MISARDLIKVTKRTHRARNKAGVTDVPTSKDRESMLTELRTKGTSNSNGIQIKRPHQRVTTARLTKYDDKYKLAAVLKEGQEVPGDGHPFEGPDRASAVLQTYTVSLAEVKRDINLWKEPLQAELEALVGTGTIRRVKQSRLSQEPGYDRMEVAPAKSVPTIKSPSGKRKARIVICGNLVHQADHVRNVQMPDQEMEISDGTGLRAPQCGKGDEPGGNPGGGPDGNGPPDQSAASDLYAGGVDATALRCVLRKAAASSMVFGLYGCSRSFLVGPETTGQATFAGD